MIQLCRLITKKNLPTLKIQPLNKMRPLNIKTKLLLNNNNHNNNNLKMIWWIKLFYENTPSKRNRVLFLILQLLNKQVSSRQYFLILLCLDPMVQKWKIKMQTNSKKVILLEK
jgi:hypothetical protein